MYWESVNNALIVSWAHSVLAKGPGMLGQWLAITDSNQTGITPGLCRALVTKAALPSQREMRQTHSCHLQMILDSAVLEAWQ